jgi:enterochelin esterase-like enzyme
MTSPRRRIVLALVALAWLGAGVVGAAAYVNRYVVYRGFPVPATPPGIARGTVREVSFHSQATGADSRYLVYLPPGYDRMSAHGRRFPVLYLLHGSPGRLTDFVDIGAVHVAANVLIAHHQMPPMILVMPAGKTGSRFGADTEWANTGAGRWMDYVLDVVGDVDRRFATIRDRRGRGLAGDSEGGFAAANIALHHPDEFSVIESWAGYFTETPTSVFKGASAAALRANSPAAYVGALAPQIRRLGLRAWLYQGRVDVADPAALRRFGSELHAAGADVHVAFFPGGHDWRLFRARTPEMLAAAGRWFARDPRAGRPALHSTGRSLPLAVLRRRERERHARCLAIPAGAPVPGSCRHYRERILGHA